MRHDPHPTPRGAPSTVGVGVSSTEPPSRRERNAAATKERLLDAAEAEFAAKGFPGARLKAIADAASVQPALIAHYFGDKEGLYKAVLDRALAVAADGSWSILERFHDPRELVEAFVDFLIDLHARSGPLLAILRHEAMAGGTAAGLAVLRERNRPLFEAIQREIERLQRRGKIRAGVDARELVLATMGMTVYPFQDAALLEVVWPGPSDAAADALARRKRTIVEIVLGGILPR